MQPKTLAAHLATAIQARKNCIAASNLEWKQKHEDTIRALSQSLPSGAGIDAGTSIDLDKSTAEKIVLHTAFHHVHESGMYDGWTEHTITIRPEFDGISVGVSGRNRNDIKDYLTDTFHQALSACYTQHYDPVSDCVVIQPFRGEE